MKNKKIILGLVVLVVVASVFTGCASASARHEHVEGLSLFGKHNRVPIKDFNPLGLVFVEKEFTIDSKGGIDGEIYTYQALLQEAKTQYNAHAIINVVIDKKFQNETAALSTVNRETWYGSALAIHYTDLIKNTSSSSTTISTQNGAQTSTSSSELPLFNGEGTQESQSGGTQSEDAPAKKGLFGLFGR